MISEDFKDARDALNSTLLAPYHGAVPSHPDSKALTSYQPGCSFKYLVEALIVYVWIKN